jgi:hypothetical protein
MEPIQNPSMPNMTQAIIFLLLGAVSYDIRIC